MVQDLLFGVRLLGRRPGFALLVVLTLALGIGANTAMFSLVNGVLLRPLPYPAAGEIVRIHTQRMGRGFGGISEPEFVDLERDTTAFGAIGLFRPVGANLAEGQGEPEYVTATLATPGVLDALGVRPQLGRTLAAGEGDAGRSQVAILSDGLWQRRFGGARDAIGRSLRILGGRYEIVGVMPPGFAFPDAETDLWVGYGLDRANLVGRGAHFGNIVARVRAGSSMARAEAELDALSARLRDTHQDVYKPGSGFHFVAQTVLDNVTGEARPALLMLMGAVALVLLIACANVANLLLARLTGRERELAIRAALGAGRGRILRQMLTECLVLGALAGLAGLAAARWAFDALVALYPDSLPRLAGAGLDGRVLLFNAGLALLVTLAVGTLPALGVSGLTASTALKDAGRMAGGARRSRRRTLLVVTEVALATVLLVGAGLLVRSLQRLAAAPPGFQVAHVLTARLTLPRERYPDAAARVRFHRRLMDELASRPDVVRAAAVNFLPVSGDVMDWYVGAEGYVPPDPNADFVQYRTVTPGYFETLGIPLVRGRGFTDEDAAGAQPVAILSAALARRFWGDADPIGRRVRPSGVESSEPWHVVVGIVGDVQHSGPRGGDVPIWYRCAYQDAWGTMSLALRTAGDPTQAVRTLKSAVARVDPREPVYEVRPMRELAREIVSADRLDADLLALFAALALALAAIGLYGVLAHEVGRRTPEIGVRMALGARPGQVLRAVLGEGVALVAAGLGLGLAGALALARLLRWLLFGVGAGDPATFAGAAAGLLVVSVLACLLPAWRACRVDPLTTLRHD
jgi:putative ABC transport system permease protein